MPAAALISGYGLMRMARRKGHHPGTLMPSGALDRMTDLCSGWRRGGTAVLSIAAGQGVPMQDCPPAPLLSSGDRVRLARHRSPRDGLDAPAPLHRRLRSAPTGTFAIWAMFRDTVGEGGGDEVVLHEYAVRAEGVDGVVGSVVAEPRVLPFPECPAAADAVGALVGSEVRALGFGRARHPDRDRLVHAPERSSACARRGGGPRLSGGRGLRGDLPWGELEVGLLEHPVVEETPLLGGPETEHLAQDVARCARPGWGSCRVNPAGASLRRKPLCS